MSPEDSPAGDGRARRGGSPAVSVRRSSLESCTGSASCRDSGSSAKSADAGEADNGDEQAENQGNDGDYKSCGSHAVSLRLLAAEDAGDDADDGKDSARDAGNRAGNE